MKRLMKQSSVLLPVMGLRSYLARLKRCRLFIANEDGPLHMAMALGVPTVGIFGPSYNKYWFYYKDNFKKILSKNIMVEKVIKEIAGWRPKKKKSR